MRVTVTVENHQPVSLVSLHQAIKESLVESESQACVYVGRVVRDDGVYWDIDDWAVVDLATNLMHRINAVELLPDDFGYVDWDASTGRALQPGEAVHVTVAR